MSEYTITYTTIEDADEFEFWCGAYDRMAGATPEQREAVYARIEDACESGNLTKTDINDIVWFECDDIFDYDEDEDEDEEE